MRMRSTDLAVTAGCVLVAALGVVWLAGGFTPKPVRLDEAVRLARLGRFDDARAELGRFFASQPKNPRARMLAAQVELDRADPEPRAALDHLAGATPESTPMEAMYAYLRGRAWYYLADYAKAEGEWREALRLNPVIPEAGWALLDLYYVEGRRDESQALALRLREVEPDPRDKVLYLLELIRQEARQLAPTLVVIRLERALKTNPDDVRALVGLGRALIRDSKLDAGLERLKRATELAPNDLAAWDAYLGGLDDAGRAGEFNEALAKAPAEAVNSPAFAKFQGRAAQNQGDWPKAIVAYRKALAHRADEPSVAYRLSRSLRAAGEAEEAERVEKRTRDFEAAATEIGPAYDEADAIKTHGVEPHTKLYKRLGSICERLGRPREANAWYEQILKDTPGDPDSLAALERLKP